MRPLIAALVMMSTFVGPMSAETSEFSPTTLPPDVALPEVSPPAETLDLADVYDGLSDIIEDLEPREPDLLDLGFEMATPEDALAFVREQIRTEPYVGSLRAPAAVVAARAGNPLDKARLLVALLDTMGYTATVQAAPADAPYPDALRTASCGPGPELQRSALALAGLNEEALARLQARAARDFGALETAVNGLDGKSPTPSQQPMRYWVAFDDLAGALRADPTLPDLELPDAGNTWDDDDDMRHKVRFRVLSETLTDGRLGETELLSVELDARDAAGFPLHLIFGTEGGGTGGAIAGALSDALGAKTGIKPIFFVDDERIVGRVFAEPGLANAGGLAQTQDHVVTAVYVDLESTSPGAEPRTERRVLLDLVSPDARHAGEITVDAVREPEPGNMMPSALEGFISFAVSHGGLSALDIAGKRAVLALNILEVQEAVAEGDVALEGMLRTQWVGLMTSVVASEAVTRALPVSATGGCTYVGRPRIYMTSLSLQGDDTVTTLDWALDGVDHSGAPEEARRTAAWHGALQSALETTLGELRAGPDMVLESTSLLLTPPLRILDDAAADALAESEPAAQRDLDAGYVLASGDNASPAVAWWRVHPDELRVDARLGESGNAFKMKGKIPGYGGYGKGIVNIGGPMTKWEIYALSDEAKFARSKARLAKMRAAKANSRWHRMLRRGGGGTEYLVTLMVSEITAEVAITVIGAELSSLMFYALYGFKP